MFDFFICSITTNVGSLVEAVGCGNSHKAMLQLRGYQNDIKNHSLLISAHQMFDELLEILISLIFGGNQLDTVGLIGLVPWWLFHCT